MGTSKYINAFQAGYTYLNSSALKWPVIFGLPPAISIELTSHCNLHCPECPSGNGSLTRSKGFIDTGLFRKIIEELKPYLFNANLYFQGEPMIHPDFFSLISIAASVKTTVSTNGHFLSADNCERLAVSYLSRIIVSLDGFDQDTYSIYRVNGNFDRVKNGIMTLSEAVRKNHSSLKIIIQVLVNRHNEAQIPQIRKFARENGIAIALKSMQIYHEKEEWLPVSEAFRRYEIRHGKYEIKGRMDGNCSRLWFNPVITWDGKVLPCCFDKNADHVMGNMNKETFRSIWKGEKYQEFRMKLLKNREQIEICRNCTSGLKGVRG